MKSLSAMSQCVAGVSMYRIQEATGENVKTVCFYGQAELQEDLEQCIRKDVERKCLTVDADADITVFRKGDIVFSLMSGTASIVSAAHDGYAWTQNYVRINPKESIEPAYLVYVLNEDREIRKQLLITLQGSIVQRYTLAQLKELRLPAIPSKEKQKLMGDIYLKQKKVTALKNRLAKRMEQRTLYMLRGVK